MAKLRVASALSNIGRRIGEIRRSHGWTQEVMAEKMRVSVGYLQSIEGGLENLTIRSLVRIANVLGATLADLVANPKSRGPRRTGRPKRG